MLKDKHKKKSGGCPWLMIALLALIVISIGVGLNLSSNQANADTAATSVTVGNVVPVLSGDAAEATASADGTGLAGTAGNPINVGATVAIQATATDANGDAYKMLVCSSGSTSGVSCAATELCADASTASGQQASCNYTGLQGDGPSVAWYVFVCDAVDCSADPGNQGTGDSGSPIYVNHAASFSAFSDNSPKLPSQAVTFSATASDDEAAGTDDNIKLYVCGDASGFTGGETPACTGTTLCSSTPGTTNPTCDYNIANPKQDNTYVGKGYIVDSHGLVAGGDGQGLDAVLTVSNAIPTVSSVVLKDASGNLSLTEEGGATTGFQVTYTVSDSNSCLNASAGNEIADGDIFVYRSSINFGGCSTTGDYNANNCYPEQNTTWGTHDCVQDVGTCSGATDSDVNWTCTFPLQYHADHTEADGKFAGDTWMASIIAGDDNLASSTMAQTVSGVEMDPFMAYAATSTLAYGTLAPGATSTEATINVSSTGNVGLDVRLYGTDMTAGEETIAVGQQKYNLTSGRDWGGTGSTALGLEGGTLGVEVELNIAKTTVTTAYAGAPIYWIIKIPDAQPAGAYTGTDTIMGVTGESANW